MEIYNLFMHSSLTSRKGDIFVECIISGLQTTYYRPQTTDWV